MSVIIARPEPKKIIYPPEHCPECQAMWELIQEYDREDAVDRGALLIEDVRGDRNECA